jgi:asparagine synthase (glutamine-hydrolysing)
MKVTRQGLRTWQYWSPAFDIQENLTLPQAVEQIEALAPDSVDRRMISDVPLGGFLSGGVDSSSVVAFMAQRAGATVKSFSIGFTNEAFDELPYARLVAERYRTEHHEKVVTPSVHEILKTLVDHYDEPFGDSSAIPTLYLSRMTRQFVTVALSGDGADELFGGYRRYFYGVLEDRLRQRFPEWFRNTVFRYAGRYYPKFDYLPRVFRGKTLLTNLSRSLGDSYFTSLSAFRDEGLNAVLSPALRRDLAGYSPRDGYRKLFEEVSHLPPLQQMQAVDLKTYLPGDILVKVDRATMAYSLESRAPWLDHRLASVACRLPAGLKLNGKVGKYAFKQVVRKHIPESILTRPKMGFGVPLGEWFRTSLYPVFESIVLQPEMESYLDLREVRRIWGEHQSKLHSHEAKLWNLLMLATWNLRHHHADTRDSLAQALSV